jgi:RNA polymerase sigma-70 factor (ECF subfamily)
VEVRLRSVASDDAAEREAVGLANAFETFVGDESARLFRALFLITGSRQESEETMQDAFLAIWERWDRVSGMDDPTGYLFRTAMNLSRKRRRRAALAIRHAFATSPSEDPFVVVEDREVVFRALRGLDRRERAAIVLTSLLDYSSEEAGRILGTSAGSVRMMASRARAHLRETVGDGS